MKSTWHATLNFHLCCHGLGYLRQPSSNPLLLEWPSPVLMNLPSKPISPSRSEGSRDTSPSPICRWWVPVQPFSVTRVSTGTGDTQVTRFVCCLADRRLLICFCVHVCVTSSPCFCFQPQRIWSQRKKLPLRFRFSVRVTFQVVGADRRGTVEGT